MPKFTPVTRRRFARIGSGASWCLRYRLPRQAERLPGAQLSREAKQRLRILDYARTHSVAATCRHFGIARSTYYRWASRYDPQRRTLREDRSSCPERCRRPTWTATQVEAVRQAREAHPRWGKDQLAVVLTRQGITLSVSMIGRILRDLKHRGIIAGGTFAFLTSFDEPIVALFLSRSDLVTLPVQIYTYLRFKPDPTIAAIATVMILLSLVAVLLADRLVGLGRMMGLSR